MFAQEVNEIVVSSFLPAVAILIPAITAAIVALIDSRNGKLRNFFALAGAVITLGVVIAIARRVFGGNTLYLETRLAGLDGFSLKFYVDTLGALFALVASTLWVFALAHACDYMSHEKKQTRFFTFVMVCEAATLGVFLVHDFLSLFIFFEIMSLSAYFLIVHSETEVARKAATKYIYMALIGGLALLMGTFLYFYFAGTLSFIPDPNSVYLEGLRVTALVLLIIGFGVKAGMIPLHVWLPDAHPAAPSPASALLSGVMIKTGAYGILRTAMSFFYTPLSHEVEKAAQVISYNAESITGTIGHTIESVAHGAEAVTSGMVGITSDLRTLGFVIIWIAIITMFTGVVLAVAQRDIKRTLAYSSISQMGFILMGVGCQVYLGGENGFGLTGSLFHVINHALFKGALFLIAGSILFRAHELNMFNLGGLYRKMPVSTLFWCVASLAIMGIPFFNGFASKCLLHHAIVEAGYAGGEVALSQAFWLNAAEKIFIITCGGTVLYFLKMTYFTFFKSPRSNHHLNSEIKEVPFLMLAGPGALALGVVVIGFMPETVVRNLLLPVLEIFPGFEFSAIEHIANIKILAWVNIKDVFPPLVIGIVAFAIGMKFDLFNPDRERRIIIPEWLSFDYWYQRLAGEIASLFTERRVIIPEWLSFDYWYQRSVRGIISLLVGLNTCFARFQQIFIGTVRDLGLAGKRFIRRFVPVLEPQLLDIALGTLFIAIMLIVILGLIYFKLLIS